MDIEIRVAIIGLAITSVFAVVGLFLNFLALRQSNRIAVSTKLSEASRILSDELVFVSQSKRFIEKELKELDSHPDSEEKVRKAPALSDLLAQKIQRQNDIDQRQGEFSNFFKTLDRVRPGDVDEVISISYSHRALADSAHDLIEDIQRGTS